MVKYYCNKCGTNINSKMLRVQTADANGEKQSYHLCFNCSAMFESFMKMNPLRVSTSSDELTEEQKDMVAERVSSVSDPKLGELLPSQHDSANKERTLEQIVSDTVKEVVGREHVKESPDDKIPDNKDGDEGKQTAKKQAEKMANKTKPREGRNVKYITPENKDFIEKHAFDMTPADIARRLDIPYQSVYQCVNTIKRTKGEISVKGTSFISDNEAGKIVALKRAGWSIKDIAGDLGHEIEEVQQVLRNAGM